MHPLYDIIVRDITVDIREMVEEGHDQKTLLRELEEAKSTGSFDALLALQEELWHRSSPAGFPYDEPNDWETISSHFPAPESHRKFAGSAEYLADRIHAGWLGRCAGCQLGKPIEGYRREKAERTLRFVGSWPLKDYMNPLPDGVTCEQLPEADGLRRRCPHTRGQFTSVSPDDDIHYALISQRVLEKYGTEFTTEQVIEQITHYTPGSTIFCSGRNMWRTGLFGLKPPFTALYGNPCRQSLGAMIRCDPWGWGAPSNPALAARMAFKDAVGSQVRNGIYSEIFFAALMADSFGGDVVRSIDTAIQYVPPRTRFAEMVHFVRTQCAAEQDWQKVNAAIYARYAPESVAANHSIPNAAIVLMGLIMGQGDFTQTLGITVMAGLDTDCTGATAGSIMGCALGTRGIPSHWTEPFHDTIRTDLSGMAELKISEVARRMYDAAKGNARYA